MKVLVLGGTGVISREVVHELLTMGHDVTAFNRGKNKSVLTSTVRIIQGDRKHKDSFKKAFRSESFDVVIDMISFDKEDASTTLDAFPDVQQIIFCSTVAAYKRPLKTIPTTESSEDLFDNPQFSYSFNKAEMERYLLERQGSTSPAITVLRPSLTYGIGGTNLGVLRQNRNIVDRIMKGKPLVMFGDGTNPWNFTFAPDVARAFAGSAGNPKTYGQCYHVTHEALYQWDDLYYEFGKILGKEPNIVHVPTDFLMSADPNLFGHLYFEKMYPGVFDNSKIKRDVPNYNPTINLAAGLEMMTSWYNESNFPLDEEKDQFEDYLIRSF